MSSSLSPQLLIDSFLEAAQILRAAQETLARSSGEITTALAHLRPLVERGEKATASLESHQSTAANLSEAVQQLAQLQPSFQAIGKQLERIEAVPLQLTTAANHVRSALRPKSTRIWVTAVTVVLVSVLGVLAVLLTVRPTALLPPSLQRPLALGLAIEENLKALPPERQDQLTALLQTLTEDFPR